MKLKLRSVQFKFRCSSCGKFVWLDWKVKRSGKLRIGHYNQHSEAPGSKRQWAWLWNTLSICDILRIVLPADLVSLESLLVCQCALLPHTLSLLVSSMQLREHSWVLTVHLQLLAFFWIVFSAFLQILSCQCFDALRIFALTRCICDCRDITIWFFPASFLVVFASGLSFTLLLILSDWAVVTWHVVTIVLLDETWGLSRSLASSLFYFPRSRAYLWCTHFSPDSWKL